MFWGNYMPYAHGITREDVFTAASEIFASGKNPTQAAVRSRLGKGSFATISKYLQEWRSEQQPEADAQTTEEEMPDQVRLLLKRAYIAIRAHVETSSTAEQVTLLETENETLKDALADYEKTKAELAGLRSAYQEVLTRLEAVVRENDRINKYLPDIEQVEKLKVGIQTFRDNNIALQAQQKTYQNRVNELETKLQTKYDQVNALEAEFSGLQAQVTNLQIEATKVEHLQTRLKEAEAEVKNLTKKVGFKGKQEEQFTTIGDEVVKLPVEIIQLIETEVQFRLSKQSVKAVAEPQPEPKPASKRRTRKPSTKQSDFDAKAEAFIQDAVQEVKGGES